MYVKTNWQDLPNQTTPINASNLNKIENGIYNNDANITTLQTDVENLKTIPCCTAKGGATVTITTASSATKLPLTEFIQNNDSFQISDGGIKCPYTGTISVTASAMVSPRTGYTGLLIRKGSSLAADAYFPTGTQTYGFEETANRVFQVNQNDIIYLYGSSDRVNDVYQMNNSRSRVTIMYVSRP